MLQSFFIFRNRKRISKWHSKIFIKHNPKKGSNPCAQDAYKDLSKQTDNKKRKEKIPYSLNQSKTSIKFRKESLPSPTELQVQSKKECRKTIFSYNSLIMNQRLLKIKFKMNISPCWICQDTRHTGQERSLNSIEHFVCLEEEKQRRQKG